MSESVFHQYPKDIFAADIPNVLKFCTSCSQINLLICLYRVIQGAFVNALLLKKYERNTRNKEIKRHQMNGKSNNANVQIGCQLMPTST